MKAKKPTGARTYKVFYRDSQPDHENDRDTIVDALNGLGIWARSSPAGGSECAEGFITVYEKDVGAARAIATALRLRLWSKQDPGPRGEEADTCGWLPCPKCGGCPSGNCECDHSTTKKVRASLHVKLRDIVDRRKAKVTKARLPRRKAIY